MSEQAEVAVTHKTCLITVVEPGMPDKVIKVRPSLHETEKIWLDNRPGIERWAAVQQLLKRFCPRGKYVPEPSYWHQPGAKAEDIGVLILRPEDIPVVELDGAVFEPLPKEHRPKRDKQPDAGKVAQEKVAGMQEQIASLTSTVASLVAAITPLIAAKVTAPTQSEEAEKRGPGRPRKTE